MSTTQLSSQSATTNWRQIEPSKDIYESWCTAASIYRPHVAYALVSPEAGHGLVAKQRIEVGENFVSIPVESILTERGARESVIGKLVDEVNQEVGNENGPKHHISPRTMLYLYLIHVRCTPSNRFHIWFVHGIPRTYSTPLTWTDEEKALLQGTNLGEAIPHRLSQLQARFKNAIGPLRVKRPDLFPEEEFNEEAFLWAHDTYSSRGFPAQLAEPSLAPKQAINPNAFTSSSSSSSRSEEKGPTINTSSAATAASSSSPSSTTGPIAPSSSLGCLIPYIDLSNHRYRHPITWIHAAASEKPHEHDAILAQQGLPSTSDARVVFQSGCVTEAGAEIVNNYGAKTNEEFLMGYGFTMRDNPEDEVTVALGARGLSEEKLALIHRYNLKLHHYLRRDGVIPEALFQLLRISVMNQEEMQEWSVKDEAKELESSLVLLSSSPNYVTVQSLRSLSSISLRNELCMLQTLRTLLYGRLVRLSPPNPPPTPMPINPFDGKQYFHRPTPLVHQEITLESMSVKITDSRAFAPFTETDRQARDKNWTEEGGAKNYHIECAYNYRMGQREILCAALDKIDQLIEQQVLLIGEGVNTFAVMQSFALQPTSVLKVDPTSSSSTPVEESIEDGSSKKRRKTGRNTSTSVSSPLTETPTITTATSTASNTSSSSEVLPSPVLDFTQTVKLSQWLTARGPPTHGKAFQSGCWKVIDQRYEWTIADRTPPLPPKTTTAAKTKTKKKGPPTIDSFTGMPMVEPPTVAHSYPCIFSIPTAAVMSTDAIEQSVTFQPILNQLPEDLPCEDIIFVFFVLHEYAKGEGSAWAPWLQLVWDRRYQWDGLTETVFPQTSGERGATIIQAFEKMYLPMLPQSESITPKNRAERWHKFLHATCIVQEYCCEIQTKTEFLKFLLPVSTMPAVVPTSLHGVFKLDEVSFTSTHPYHTPATSKQIVLYSLAPFIPAETVVRFSAEYLVATLLPPSPALTAAQQHTFFTPRQMCDVPLAPTTSPSPSTAASSSSSRNLAERRIDDSDEEDESEEIEKEEIEEEDAEEMDEE